MARAQTAYPNRKDVPADRRHKIGASFAEAAPLKALKRASEERDRDH
jgi:hypothetical protein